MTFEEMVRAVSRTANGYATLGIKVGPEDIASALSRGQQFVAGDLATYAHRALDESQPDPFATDLTINQAVALPADSEMDPELLLALDPPREFNAEGTVEPSLPLYAHDAIVTRAVLLLLAPSNPKALLDQYELEIQHARRSFLMTRPNRVVQVKDGYDPYRFTRSEW